MNSGEEDARRRPPIDIMIPADERIDDLIDDMRKLTARTNSALEIGRMTFRHVCDISQTLRGAGISRARPWRDIALIAITVAVMCGGFAAIEIVLH